MSTHLLFNRNAACSLIFFLSAVAAYASEPDTRSKAAAAAEKLFSSTHFFHEGNGMHLSPGVLDSFNTLEKTSMKTKLLKHVSVRKWGLNWVDDAPVGLQTIDYRGQSVPVLGCVACHSGKAAGQLYIGLGNKNIDVGTMGNLANIGLRAWKAWGSLSREKNSDYRKIEDSSLEIAKLLNWTQYNNLTQGLVPTSLIRTWFYKDAGLEIPSKFNRAATKVPQLWGYGPKREAGLFCDGFGNGNKPGWALAVEFVAGQTPAGTRSLLEKAEHAESALTQLLPPRYPFSIRGELAEKGKIHFQNSCQHCHGKYERDDEGQPIFASPKIIPWFKVKTDPDRLDSITDEFVDLVSRSSLADVVQTNGKTNGYFAPRLDGIWARFPYLHNGSVPTLYDLLENKINRPNYFSMVDAGEEYRFDKMRVGLTHPNPDEALKLSQKSLTGARDVYDVGRVGQSNQGHEFGIELKNSEKMELIEYLKTL